MRNLRKLYFLIGIIFFGVISFSVYADGIKLRQIQIEPVENNWTVNVSYQIDLLPELEEVVKKGITFHFLTELNVTRGRWYWFEEKPEQVIKNIRLSYHPLTFQYRISAGGLTISAATLEEALIQVGSIGGWQVAELNSLENGKTYQGEVRMRLDLSQLPKPFQINALNAREWNVSSGWHQFSFVPQYKNTTNK